MYFISYMLQFGYAIIKIIYYPPIYLIVKYTYL